MSIAVVVKGPEGLALATDSRLTYFDGIRHYATRDDEMKVLSFREPHMSVAAVMYGRCEPELMPAGLVHELEAELSDERLAVNEYARRLGDFFARQARARAQLPYDSFFIVAGFDPGDQRGRVYVVRVPDEPRARRAARR